MSCQCQERAEAIRAAMLAAGTGDASKLLPAAGFVVRTSAEDLANAGRRAVERTRAAAAARLGLRR